MNEDTLNSLHTLAENAYGYLNTPEGLTNVAVAVSAILVRYLMAEFGLPVAKKVLTGTVNLFRSKPSLLLGEVLNSLDDPNALLNESLTGNHFDELMTNVFVVKYDRPVMPATSAIRGIYTNGRNVLDVLTDREKKTVTKKLQAAIHRVKLRDWTNQREEALRLLTSDLAKSDASRRA